MKIENTIKHELKIWPEHFERVKDGSKTFEIRDNDRFFQCGDIVALREWDPKVESKREIVNPLMLGTAKSRYELGNYTGCTEVFEIGCVYPIDEKRVVFSLLKIEL